MSDAARIADQIRQGLPTLKRGTLRFWGQWFGRPYDNIHTITGASSDRDALVVNFDNGETLLILRPSKRPLTGRRSRFATQPACDGSGTPTGTRRVGAISRNTSDTAIRSRPPPTSTGRLPSSNHLGLRQPSRYFEGLFGDAGREGGLPDSCFAFRTGYGEALPNIDTPSIQIAREWPIGRAPNSGAHTGMKHIVPQIRCPPSNRHTPRSSPFAGQVESL